MIFNADFYPCNSDFFPQNANMCSRNQGNWPPPPPSGRFSDASWARRGKKTLSCGLFARKICNGWAFRFIQVLSSFKNMDNHNRNGELFIARFDSMGIPRPCIVSIPMVCGPKDIVWSSCIMFYNFLPWILGAGPIWGNGAVKWTLNWVIHVFTG